jgi:hypothetical protein
MGVVRRTIVDDHESPGEIRRRYAHTAANAKSAEFPRPAPASRCRGDGDPAATGGLRKSNFGRGADSALPSLVAYALALRRCGIVAPLPVSAGLIAKFLRRSG